MGFDSYSPRSQLMHCSKQSHVCLTREILSQQVRSRNSQVVLVGALATLVGCAPLAEVREINPRLGAQHGTLPQLQRAEQQIANGQELERAAPNKAIGSYLAGLQSATSELRNSPKDRIALRDRRLDDLHAEAAGQFLITRLPTRPTLTCSEVDG